MLLTTIVSLCTHLRFQLKRSIAADELSKNGKKIKSRFVFISNEILKVNNICVFSFQAKTKAWTDIERFAGSKYPICIKRILILSGYDNLVSLRAINEDSVLKLEEHINKNRNTLDELECCFSELYKKQDVFEFIPGHRMAILDIPRQIDQMQSKKMERSLGRNRKKRSVAELQKMLIAQLNGYSSKAGYKLPEDVISELNIVNVQSDEQSDGSLIVKCDFTCPFCTKHIKVSFKNFWWASNATKHLKTHVVEHLARNAGV